MTDIDALTRRLDNIVKSIDAALDAEARKRKQSFHLTHDDGVDDNGNNYDDVSNPSMAADDDSDGDGDGDGYNPGAGSEVTLGDDNDEDDDDVTKYQRGEEIAAYAQRNDSTHRPGSLATSDHPSSNNARHRFLALVAAIKNEHGIPATQAMAYARQKDPTGYAAFQGRPVTKRAPVTFEDLVNEQMMKGCSHEVAAQRVMQMHGAAALQHRAMSKRAAIAEVAENELIAKAQSVWEDDGTLDRCGALRAARKAHPRLFKAMR
jgi:hypothetical protein